MKSMSIWLKSIYFLTWGSLCLMLAGFGWAIREMVKPPEKKQPPAGNGLPFSGTRQKAFARPRRFLDPRSRRPQRTRLLRDHPKKVATPFSPFPIHQFKRPGTNFPTFAGSIKKSTHPGICQRSGCAGDHHRRQ